MTMASKDGSTWVEPLFTVVTGAVTAVPPAVPLAVPALVAPEVDEASEVATTNISTTQVARTIFCATVECILSSNIGQCS